MTTRRRDAELAQLRIQRDGARQVCRELLADFKAQRERAEKAEAALAQLLAGRGRSTASEPVISKPEDARPVVVDAAFLERERAWSLEVFGPGPRVDTLLNHIRSELEEISADPTDVVEWVDVIILAFDGAWRAGWEPQQVLDTLADKLTRNENRTWPDWRTVPEGHVIHHLDAGGESS